MRLCGEISVVVGTMEAKDSEQVESSFIVFAMNICKEWGINSKFDCWGNVSALDIYNVIHKQYCVCWI